MERELTALEQRLYKFLDDMDTHLEYDPSPERWKIMRDKLKKCKQDCMVEYGVVNNGYSLHIHLPYKFNEIVVHQVHNCNELTPRSFKASLARHFEAVKDEGCDCLFCRTLNNRTK